MLDKGTAQCLYIQVGLRIATKCATLCSNMEDVHNKIQNVYSSGAVEGYSSQYSGCKFECPCLTHEPIMSLLELFMFRASRQEDQLRELYKQATKVPGSYRGNCILYGSVLTFLLHIQGSRTRSRSRFAASVSQFQRLLQRLRQRPKPRPKATLQRQGHLKNRMRRLQLQCPTAGSAGRFAAPFLPLAAR